MPNWNFMNDLNLTADRGARRGRLPPGSTFIQFQRASASPRDQWVNRRREVEQPNEDVIASSEVPAGYIPPGTHAIPTARNTRIPSSFLSALRQRQNYMALNLECQESMFPDKEEDSFFPPETLPPIDLEFGGCYSFNFNDSSDERSREKFNERLASFPEVPLDAHRRILQMGNEIVDCFEVRLERFYRGSLLDSVANCVAVFTKKERTGQRWLMVFKEESSRTVVKFNRLLTHSLLVSVVSTTAIEIEAAKSLYGPPAEMCVINFRNVEEATRFFRTLQESQTTAWNHREVTQEQRMKSLYNRINVALAQQNEFIQYISNQGPLPRTPFTVRQAPGMARSIAEEHEYRQQDPRTTTHSNMHLADLDNDWRRRNLGECEVGTSSLASTKPFRRVPPGVKAGISRSEANISANNHTGDFSWKESNGKINMDGGGDFKGKVTETFPEEIVFELSPVTLFAKRESAFEKMGEGALKIIDHKDFALNELKFFGENNKELIQQYIFKWNELTKTSEDGKDIYEWDGAATFSADPEAVPERTLFKITTENSAIKFKDAFDKAVEKSKDDGIRKRHICWYLQNKRNYKVVSDARNEELTST